MVFQQITYVLLAMAVFSFDDYFETWAKNTIDDFQIQLFGISIIEKLIIYAAFVPTSLWLPIFLIQIYEQYRMVKDIRRMDVKKIMTKRPQKKSKDLIKLKQEEKIR